MKRLTTIILACALSMGFAVSALADQGVAIQRVITNTRAELGQLAESGTAQEIASLMNKFDTQYQTWSGSCGGGENFDPESASDACKAMADSMRETGIQLYGKLAAYLPDVAARYEQGARSAARITEARTSGVSATGLYQQSLDGIEEAPRLGEFTQGEPGAPFDLEMDSFPDPTDEMFAALEKIVPDLGKDIPEAVRAGNTQLSMMKKAKQARYLAQRFERAQFALESQRDYGKIIFSMTKAVQSMPGVLGLNYTGTRLAARPNQKVLDYYRQDGPQDKTGNQGTAKARVGGFESRS